MDYGEKVYLTISKKSKLITWFSDNGFYMGREGHYYNSNDFNIQYFDQNIFYNCGQKLEFQYKGEVRFSFVDNIEGYDEIFILLYEWFEESEALEKLINQEKTTPNKTENNKKYNSRTWLNPEGSSSSGSIVCFSGLGNFSYSGEKNRAEVNYVEIADCQDKVTLHKSKYDTDETFIKKIKLIKEELDKFITFLESKNDD